MPVVVKSLKSDFITPYIRNGQAVFRQKIKKQYNEYGNNNNYSDVNLQFDESGNPKFVVENGAEKQAIDTDRNPNMPWVSVYDANDGATLHYGTTIRIQKPTSQSYNLAYDPSGMPYVTQVRKQDSTLYTENNIAVFRQTFENDSDVELEFDTSGNPIFIKEANNMFRYATTTNGNSAFVVSGTNSDFNEEYIYVSDQVQPVLIQQWYPDNDNSYNTKLIVADNGALSSLVKARCKDGSYYTRNGIQVYRQVTVYEKQFKFNLGKPVFLNDISNKLSAYFRDNTEAEGYNVGELILKDGKKKCITNTVQWYDLNNYILDFVTRTSSDSIILEQNTNFIVKDNYTLNNKVSCGDYTSTLFIPNGITLTTNQTISGNDVYFKCLVLGTINHVSINSLFMFGTKNFDFILSPKSIIDIDSNANVWFLNSSTKFTVPVMYPTTLTEQFVLNDNHITSDGNNITALTSSAVHTFAERGVLYLNRFTKDNAEEAKKLKGTIQYDVDIVFPEFLGTNSNYYFDEMMFGGQGFTRNTFFPNLLWFVPLNGEHNKGTIIPTNIDDLHYRKNQYFFENYNYKYEDVYKSDIIWKYYNESGVVLALDENNTQIIGTNVNPFVEYDEKFLNVSIPNETISKLISTVPFKNNETTYNIITNSNNKNCYWDTNTIQVCFEDGAFYLPFGSPRTGILNNLPATLNIGLINENTADKENERVSTDPSTTEITLNGDNQYFYGIYTVPAITTKINLNNKNALIKVEQLDGNGNIKYKTPDDPSSRVDLSNLTYNIMSDIYWDLNKTGENLVSSNTIYLDMNLTNENNATFITFTESTHDIQAISFTGNNTRYTIDGSVNNDLSNRGYFRPAPTISSVIFKDEDSIVKILTGQNVIWTSFDRIKTEPTKTAGFLLKKDIKDCGSSINKITDGSNTYIKYSNNKWYNINDNVHAEDLSDTIKSKYFYTIDSLPDLDNRDTITNMRKSDYVYNQYSLGGGYCINTEKTSEEDKINELFYEDQDGRNNMPPIINLGLINDGNIKVVNNSNINTTVELKGANNGIRNDSSNKLYCYTDQYAQEITSTHQNPIGKPYTGTMTVPNETTDIKFSYSSFIPNINTFQNSTNEGDTIQYTGNYTFLDDNNVQMYNVSDGLQDINGDGITIDYKVDKLKLNLSKIAVGEQTITAAVMFNEATVNASNFAISKESVVTLSNNSHLSVKPNNNKL